MKSLFRRIKRLFYFFNWIARPKDVGDDFRQFVIYDESSNDFLIRARFNEWWIAFLEQELAKKNNITKEEMAKLRKFERQKAGLYD